MRLIDADALLEQMKHRRDYVGRPSDPVCLVEDAPTVSRWVSVKDRMPKDGQDVLAYLNDGEETRIAPCNYFNGVWFDSVMNCVVVLQDVTHWMPLPKSPEVDNGSD